MAIVARKGAYRMAAYNPKHKKRSSSATTVTVGACKVTTWKDKKGRYRWMARRDKKIIAGGMSTSRDVALREAKAACTGKAAVRKLTKTNPRKKAKRKTGKRKATKRKSTKRKAKKSTKRKSTKRKKAPRRNPSKKSLERSIASLRKKRTISTGQASDLKAEGKVGGIPTRWWLSRMTLADGETHAVDVEQYRGGRWSTVHRYGKPQANPRKRTKRKAKKSTKRKARRNPSRSTHAEQAKSREASAERQVVAASVAWERGDLVTARKYARDALRLEYQAAQEWVHAQESRRAMQAQNRAQAIEVALETAFRTGKLRGNPFGKSKRKATKRKSTKRKATKRKSTKRKATKRGSKKRVAKKSAPAPRRAKKRSLTALVRI